MQAIAIVKKNKWQFAVLTLIFMVALCVTSVIQKPGTGISPDTIRYYTAGVNFLSGRGFTISDYTNYGANLIPMTHWPPLYSFILAIFVQLFTQLVAAASILNTLSLCVTAALAYILLKFQFFIPTPFALAGTGLLIISRPILVIHSWAWSEPLFINCVLLSWVLLIQFNHSKKQVWLYLSAGATAAALLSRYAGLSLFLANVIPLIFIKDPIRKKIKTIFSFGLISFSPLLLWTARNFILTNELTNRNTAYHPITNEEIEKTWNSIMDWFYPKSDNIAFEYGVPLVVVGVGLILFFLLLKSFINQKYEPGKFAAFPFVLVILFSISYLTFIVLSLTYFDAGIPLDLRIFSPLYMASVILIASLLGTLINTIKTFSIKLSFTAAFSLAAVVFLIGFSVANNEWFSAYSKSGLGFAKESWVHSPTLSAISSLPDNVIIISNAPDVIDLVSSKKAYLYPSKYDPNTGLNEEGLNSQFSLLKAFADSNSPIYVVHFIDIGRNYLVSEETMIGELKLEMVMQFNDGNIYVVGK